VSHLEIPLSGYYDVLYVSLWPPLSRYDNQLQLHPTDAQRKIQMFRERYALLKQRLLRHTLFNPPPNAPSNATYLKVILPLVSRLLLVVCLLTLLFLSLCS